ncbi:heat-inducible transcriptional repressor HrcA [Ignavibacteria bacterium]|nr:heat-inducible transcription repressor HrcA [Bacteroidota bacterium]MCZ2133080.1 heat-inducible transcriptional repressor HrcA [Bacteroidota bacterium]
MNDDLAYRSIEPPNLSERERAILRSIVHIYILTASPVGSKYLSQYIEEYFKISPATIRNVMGYLEYLGFITHPHTSAGRIPTDKGYRLYVDSLMPSESISAKESDSIRENLLGLPSESILREASKILGSLSRCLSVVELPHLFDSVIRRIQLIEVSSARILVVLDLDSNLLRTVTLEADISFDRKDLDISAQFINERLAGRRVSFIRENFNALISDGDNILHGGLLRLFTDSVDALFAQYNDGGERLHISGTQSLLAQPEFDSPERIRGVIELVANQDIIVHVFDRIESGVRPLSIGIGQELGHDLLADYSVIAANYTFGTATASIGVIGPKRMNYARAVSILKCVSAALSTSGPNP